MWGGGRACHGCVVFACEVAQPPRTHPALSPPCPLPVLKEQVPPSPHACNTTMERCPCVGVLFCVPRRPLDLLRCCACVCGVQMTKAEKERTKKEKAKAFHTQADTKKKAK